MVEHRPFVIATALGPDDAAPHDPPAGGERLKIARARHVVSSAKG